MELYYLLLLRSRSVLLPLLTRQAGVPSIHIRWVGRCVYTISAIIVYSITVIAIYIADSKKYFRHSEAPNMIVTYRKKYCHYRNTYTTLKILQYTNKIKQNLLSYDVC